MQEDGGISGNGNSSSIGNRENLAQINNTQTKIKFLRKELIHIVDFVNVATWSELKEQMSVKFIIKIGYMPTNNNNNNTNNDNIFICAMEFAVGSFYAVRIFICYRGKIPWTFFFGSQNNTNNFSQLYKPRLAGWLADWRNGWLAGWLASWLVKRDAHNITINRRDKREWEGKWERNEKKREREREKGEREKKRWWHIDTGNEWLGVCKKERKKRHWCGSITGGPKPLLNNSHVN